MVKEELFSKFDRDIAKRSRVMRIVISFDQAIGCVGWNKSQDETISSYIGRKIQRNEANLFEKALCCLLRKFEQNHCFKSEGE